MHYTKYSFSIHLHHLGPGADYSISPVMGLELVLDPGPLHLTLPIFSQVDSRSRNHRAECMNMTEIILEYYLITIIYLKYFYYIKY